MSQAKVDQYKKDKANRKKILAKEKRQKAITRIVGILIAVAVVVWAGWSGYRIYESKRPAKTYTCDTSAISDYMDGLEE